MLKRLIRVRQKRFFGMVLIGVCVCADAPPPSQEFWEYMIEYGDEKGEVLDPLEYDQILTMKDTDKNESVEQEKLSMNKPRVKNTDMKNEHKSSVQAAPVVDAKGAKL
ncbi:hypothetical protein GCM10011613_12830 [Cellvibrio zantedeschiae]|uniref:Uncharacterized protein n=1 Tax=Cellvibrio zantedeschiae TaxID=1237077 RepID=A0ABQ3AWW2_9GAMM|nr:hypothetical protein [Cellvibrio zantedeschiae]GGY69898.1 hypothetical protein GCM10011613_12830 [Cellvibrio zantedeschiae]